MTIMRCAESSLKLYIALNTIRLQVYICVKKYVLRHVYEFDAIVYGCAAGRTAAYADWLRAWTNNLGTGVQRSKTDCHPGIVPAAWAMSARRVFCVPRISAYPALTLMQAIR